MGTSDLQPTEQKHRLPSGIRSGGHPVGPSSESVGSAATSREKVSELSSLFRPASVH